MKKYISMAILFASGTVIANAATILTTTFGNCNQTDAKNVTLTNTWAEGLSGLGTVTGTVNSLVKTTDNASINLLTTGPAGGDAAFFSPNTNFGAVSPWKTVFTYNNWNSVTSIDKITLSVGAFNARGEWQTVNAIWTGTISFNVRFLDATTGADLGSGVFSASKTGTDGDGLKGTGDKNTWTFDCTGTPITFDNVSSVKVEISNKKENWSRGTFVGLNSVSFSGSVVPEPSAFGLLAGLGALALVGARRRRRKTK